MTLDDEWIFLAHELIPHGERQELNHATAGTPHQQQWFTLGATLANDPLIYKGSRLNQNIGLYESAAKRKCMLRETLACAEPPKPPKKRRGWNFKKAPCPLTPEQLDEITVELDLFDEVIG